MLLKNLLRYFIKFIAWLSVSIAALAAVCLIVFTIKIYQGPISLNFIKPYFHYLISHEEGVVQVKSAILNWDKSQSRFVIRLKDVELREGKADHIIAKIEDVSVKLKLGALLKGKFVPSGISISKLHLRLFKEMDGSLTIFSDPEDDNNQAETALNFQKLIADYGELSILKPLKEIKIVDGVIKITDRATKEDWVIPKVEFLVRRNLHDIDLEGRLDLKGAQATLHAKTKLIKTSAGLADVTIEGCGKLEKLNFNELRALWPESLAPLPRAWILNNLSDGYVPMAEATIKATLDFKGTSLNFTLDDLEARVNFENMKIRYFGELPRITKVTGVARFDKKTAVIKGSSGELNNLKIKKSDILITGLDGEDQDIAIDVDVEGPIIDALQILNAPELQLARDFAIQPKNVKGSAATTLHFDFPLETALTLDKINVRASSKLSKLEINDLLARKNLPVNLSEGDLSLSMDKSEMITKGNAKLNGVPIELSWHEKFKPQKDWKSRYLIKATLEGTSLLSLGAPNIFTGAAPLNLEYTQKNLKSSTLKANVDFTSATLNNADYRFLKPMGEKCEGQFLIEFANGKIRHVHNLKIWGPHLDVQLIAKVKKDGTGLRMLESSKFQFGKTNLNVKLQKTKFGNYAVSLHGPILDIEPFMKLLMKGDNTFGNFGLELFIDIQHIRFGENKALHQCKGNGVFCEDQWKCIRFNSVIAGKRKDKPGHFIAAQEYKGKQGNFSIKASNAGEFLRLFGISDSVKGGVLFIGAGKQARGSWIGKAVIDKGFSVSNAPAATRILAAASGFGFFDAIGGETISFDKFRTNFKLGKNQILLQDGRASGASLGFTIAGLIDLKNDTCKLYGSVLPYNLFNMVLLKIPLVGSLLGGKGGGVFGVSYSVTGSTDKPEVSVNPFSALTPGFLRKIFDPTEYEDFTDGTDDDEDVEKNEKDGAQEDH